MTLFFEKPIPKKTVLSKKWQRQNNLNIYFQANHEQELYLSTSCLIDTKADSVINLTSNKNYVWLYANDRYVFSIGAGQMTDMCFQLELEARLQKNSSETPVKFWKKYLAER